MTRQKSKVNDNSFHSHAHFLRFQKKPRGSKELLLGKTGPIFIISKEMSLKLFQKNCHLKVSGKYVHMYISLCIFACAKLTEREILRYWLEQGFTNNNSGTRRHSVSSNKKRLEFKTNPFLVITCRCVRCHTNIWGIYVLMLPHQYFRPSDKFWNLNT